MPRPPRFRQLKLLVRIERLLESRGIHLRRRGPRLVGPCPLHGGDNPTAFVVSTDRGLWRCFTGCDAGGDVVELVRRLDGCDYVRAAHTLAQLACGVAPDGVDQRPPHGGLSRPFRPFRQRLRLDPASPWLAHKQIRPPTAARYEVGAYQGTGMLAGCIGVSLHDLAGGALGYAGRRLDARAAAQHGKWIFPPGLPKGELLYGHHHIAARLDRGVVVVECPWSVMRLSQLDTPAVALLGTHASARQLRLLAEMPRIALLFDGDLAGHRAASDVARLLAPRVHVRATCAPDGADPDDLSDDELRALVAALLL